MDSATPNEPQDDENALETPEQSLDATSASSESSTDATSAASASSPPPQPSKSGGLKQFLRRFNLYLLLFIFIGLLAGGIILIAYFQAQKSSQGTIKTQKLTEDTLKQVANSDASVGTPTQVLNIESNAVFTGKVLVRSSLEVAGDIQVGGTLNIANISVSGTGTFGTLQASKNLSVAGDGAIQGQLTVTKGLQVNAGGTFNGPITAPQITTSVLQLNGDLTLTHHIVAGGPQPARTSGSALGSGGTATVSGSDTSGAISINTGSGAATGCFITVTFASKYNTTPHVIVTPIGSDAGGIDYYVTRNTTSFSICDATAPAGGLNFGFDYFVVD